MVAPIRALLCSFLALSALGCEASGAAERPENAAGGAGAGGGVTGTLPDGTPASALLPARIRRLTNAEYDASVQALTSTSASPARSFAPDSRQDGYTVNELDRYTQHVEQIVPKFFQLEPLKEYSTYFNVHRVDVVSDESGVDHDPELGVLRVMIFLRFHVWRCPNGDGRRSRTAQGPLKPCRDGERGRMMTR